MAAGLTDHVWTTNALLSYRVSAACLEQLRESEHLFQVGRNSLTGVEGHSPALRPTTLLFGLEDYESRSFSFTPWGARFVERLLFN